MVLDLTCDDLHRPAAYRFVCPDTTASEVQGECRAELARAMLSRSLHSYSQLHVASTKVQHFSCTSKFRASIWGSFQHEFDELMFSTSSLLTLGRTHASMVLHSLNRSL